MFLSCAEWCSETERHWGIVKSSWLGNESLHIIIFVVIVFKITLSPIYKTMCDDLTWKLPPLFTATPNQLKKNPMMHMFQIKRFKQLFCSATCHLNLPLKPRWHVTSHGRERGTYCIQRLYLVSPTNGERTGSWFKGYDMLLQKRWNVVGRVSQWSEGNAIKNAYHAFSGRWPWPEGVNVTVTVSTDELKHIWGSSKRREEDSVFLVFSGMIWSHFSW